MKLLSRNTLNPISEVGVYKSFSAIEYRLFQAKLFPVLPILIYQAYRVQKERQTPKAQSEFIKLGNGPHKLLVLGESTVAGVGASSVDFTLAANIYRLFGEDSTVTNMGKNGIRASQVLQYFSEKLRTEKAQLDGVFIFLGANDCFKLTNPIEYNLSILQLIRTLELEFHPSYIYLADIPPVHLFPALPAMLQFYLKSQREFLRAEMKLIAKGNSKIIFDELNLNFTSEFFCEDLIHPSDLGYQAIADFAWKGIQGRI